MAERSAINLFDCKKTNRFIESRASERDFSVDTRQKKKRTFAKQKYYVCAFRAVIWQSSRFNTLADC